MSNADVARRNDPPKGGAQNRTSAVEAAKPVERPSEFAAETSIEARYWR